MPGVVVPAALGLALFMATPALAQEPGGPDIQAPGQLGVLATTATRLDRSGREMNRGRAPLRNVNLTPVQVNREALTALRRGGFECTIIEALMVARTDDGAPLIEIDCAEGGGLIIANTTPIEATDCLDIRPGNRIPECRIAANVASVAAERQSARN